METRLYGFNNLKEYDQLFFASCDSKYFIDHVVPWGESITRFDINAHAHIINPSLDCFSLIDHLKINMPKLAVTFEVTDLPNNLNTQRVYYSCNRFMVADKIVPYANTIAITDIDCLLMKKVDIPTAPIGIFLRDSLPGTIGWEFQGTKCAAGILSVSGAGKGFLNMVHARINEIVIDNGWRWFTDQVAIFEVYRSMGLEDEVFKYTKEWLDWDFVDNTIIWTGKGDRKYKDETYLKAKENVTESYYTKATS